VSSSAKWRRPMELTWPREDFFETTTGC
jgi:hypothetical protein